MQSAWEDGYMQSCYSSKPTSITSQGQALDHQSERKMVSDEHQGHESSSCCSIVVQCSQETSFSGLKHIGRSESTRFSRYGIHLFPINRSNLMSLVPIHFLVSN